MSRVDAHHLLSIGGIVRHALPNVVLSTLVPTAWFYVGWYAQGRAAAFALALGWALTLLGWRAIRKQRVPALLMITTTMLSVRTAIALASGSTKVYFVQPVVTMVIIGMLFLVSLAAGRPLIAKLAGDICPLPADVAARAEVQHHFRRLSYLWACVYFCNAAVTLFLLMNLPVTTFVATKTFTGLAIMWSGFALTATWSYRVAHEVGLIRRNTRGDVPAAATAAA